MSPREFALFESNGDEQLAAFIESALALDEFLKNQTRIVHDFIEVNDRRRVAYLLLQDDLQSQKGLAMLKAANDRERALLKITLKAMDLSTKAMREVRFALAKFPQIETAEHTTNVDVVFEILNQYNTLVWRSARLLVIERDFLERPTEQSLEKLRSERAKLLGMFKAEQATDATLNTLSLLVEETKMNGVDITLYLKDPGLMTKRVAIGGLAGAFAGILGIPVGFVTNIITFSVLPFFVIPVAAGVIAATITNLKLANIQKKAMEEAEKTSTLRHDSERILEKEQRLVRKSLAFNQPNKLTAGKQQ